MEILEEVCGARLHTSFIVPGGFLKPVSFSIISKIKNLTKRLFLTFSEIDNLLTNSRV
jgi:NADH:ubiquinone oxidoreductase subunit D